MSSITVVPTPLSGLLIIEPKVFGDERGCFFESWNERVFAGVGLEAKFVQDNHSYSTQGTLRGLHYQRQAPQGKLARVVVGEVFDVAVDLRQSSRTFGRWFGTYLSANNRREIWIPEGFAHGFYVLSAYAEFLYKCTDYYRPEDEHTMLWKDEQLGIEWPLIPGLEPLLSPRDSNGVPFKHAVVFD